MKHRGLRHRRVGMERSVRGRRDFSSRCRSERPEQQENEGGKGRGQEGSQGMGMHGGAERPGDGDPGNHLTARAMPDMAIVTPYLTIREI